MPFTATGWKGAAVGAAVGAAAARAAYALPGRGPGPGAAGGVFRVAEHSRDVWSRTNFRGEEVTLLEGPAVAAGTCAGILAAPGLDRRVRASALAATVGAAAFGCYDDLSGGAGARGFRGHLAALARGEVTTGAVKIAGIGGTGLAAAALLGRRPLDVLVDGALIAGTANLLNLFDLRPGRAAKVALAAGAPGLGGPAAGAVGAMCGAAAALVGEDLGERAMLGDAGANAMGALLGAAAAASLPRPARLALLAGVAGLTAASEFVSFSKVIAGNRVLRRIDEAGRR
ncbi:hypothetical protein [Nocardiopsis composta]|uniref:UDP-N-acetylmuramyl pentapeptide phosphotransferase/UDP-N-acetylglucosamine-1-phosphate transferase n=1 Tax=Nocardiopsis composta TaxID=157465 RepID=A0A7W8QK29_9ACTN|nr:hypothetical protein [Nocardiopsis composta]MBB5431902.1 UDP-N-acetylmuramyl pentapeptide phosphotransferase/UDP-N-acetylglucosamine-1-phosphate transferase [Nocardiopsis composta]